MRLTKIHYLVIVTLLNMGAMQALHASVPDCVIADDIIDSSAFSDSVAINFRQSKWDLDLQIGDNNINLKSFISRLQEYGADSLVQLKRIKITGGASPEGTTHFNRYLSEQRALTLRKAIEPYIDKSQIEISSTYLGSDWDGVLQAVRQCDSVPEKTSVEAVLQGIIEQNTGSNISLLRRLYNGKPYRFIYTHIFPKVRASKIVVEFDRLPGSDADILNDSAMFSHDTVWLEREVLRIDTVYIYNCCLCPPLFIDVRTNMLLDALALPNIGIEVYLGKDLSIGGQWTYGWWKNDHKHHYWRAYGGDLFLRRWFGRKSQEKPLTGHHFGLYAQIYTYDFEWGGKGEIGGNPGHDLWDKPHLGVGIEYGYSLPIKRRINLDFTIGLGYNTGIYHKYHPDHGHYVWDSSARRHYFGLSKAEVSLVWLIGCGNYNLSKGGL